MRQVARLMLLGAGLLLAGALSAQPPGAPTPAAKDDLLVMHADDPVMRAAIRRAKSELADFLELAEAPKAYQKDFAVRVGLRVSREIQYIWIKDFSQDDGGLYAGIVDEEVRLPVAFKPGDRFTFVHGDIVDWRYLDDRNARIHGAYTDCALLTLAPAAAAALVRKTWKLDCKL